jgi:heparin binding hemagglutinin HbhA
MPTPTTKDAKQALYAVAGAADLAVSTIRHLPAEAAKLRDRLPREAVKTYSALVRRGETLVTGVRRSRPTRQAAEATRTAVSRTKAANTRVRRSTGTTRSSVKAAGTSARKAAAADTKAVKEAAAKVGDK